MNSWNEDTKSILLQSIISEQWFSRCKTLIYNSIKHFLKATFQHSYQTSSQYPADNIVIVAMINFTIFGPCAILQRDQNECWWLNKLLINYYENNKHTLHIIHVFSKKLTNLCPK